MATKNSLIKQAELVPSVDQHSLSLALSELQDELAIVPEWADKAMKLAVTNAEEYKAAGEFRAQVRSHKKVVAFALAPFQEVAKRVADFLKGKRTEAENRFDAIDNLITQKMNQQAEKERLAAEAEQRRINDEKRIREEKEAAERRKEAEKQAEADRKQREKEIAEARKAGEIKAAEAKRLQKEADEKAARDKEAAAREQQEANASFKPVEVKANIPVIAGSRRHRVYSATFTDFPALLEAWRQSRNNGSMDRAAYLKRFIMGDEKELGREARDVQDSNQLVTMIPGISASDEDRT
jgi:hypothetical protein